MNDLARFNAMRECRSTQWDGIFSLKMDEIEWVK